MHLVYNLGDTTYNFQKSVLMWSDLEGIMDMASQDPVVVK